MEFVYSDGGRSKYYKAENVGDCVCRAICNATGNDYKETYKSLTRLAGETPRNGVPRKVIKKYLESILGWKWIPCMGKGTGCKVHLNENELPKGTLIVNLSRHLSCVKDGVLYDTYDCTREEKRCVYGYWVKK